MDADDEFDLSLSRPIPLPRLFVKVRSEGGRSVLYGWESERITSQPTSHCADSSDKNVRCDA